MPNNLIDQTLIFSKEQSTPVRMSLRNGETVSVRIKDFDGYVVLVEGEPDYLLYRHSISNVDGGTGHRPSRQSKPSRQAQGRKTGPAPKAAVKKRAPKKAAPEPSQQNREGQSFANPMADQLKKWLDSKKDGE